MTYPVSIVRKEDIEIENEWQRTRHSSGFLFWREYLRKAIPIVLTSFKAMLVAFVTLTVIGCGNSENFVFTGNFVPNPNAVATGAVLLPENTTLTLGQQTTYRLFITFDDGTQAEASGETYTSDDPGVVSIDPNSGVATAVMVGGTTITSTDGTFTASTPVTVTAAAVNNNPALSLIVSNADTDDLDIFTAVANFTQAAAQTFDSSPGADVRDQGILLDALNTAFHNGGDNIAIISRLFSRDGTPAFQTTEFDGDLDHEIDFTSIANVAAKGSALVADEGMMVVANFSGSMTPSPSLIVFGTSGTTFDNVDTTNRPWDAAYDDATDILYVAFTNGTIGVYDNFGSDAAAGTVSGTPDRTISPTGLDNAHGIVISGDTLIVSDVGPLTMAGNPGFDTDGEIYLISGAATADGTVTADAVISGSNPLLGNPVDIDLQNGDLRVAEKANGGGQILVFTDILNTPGGNIAPTVAVDYATPESLTALPQQDPTPGAAAGLVVSSNDGSNNELVLVDLALTTATSGLGDPTNTSESAAVDGLGDVYVTSDSLAVVLGRAGTGVRSGATGDPRRDRTFYNDGDLKGLELWDEGGLAFLADNNNDTIVVIGKYSSGSPITSLVVDVLSESPWDVFYDAANDDLYVANQNGTVDIYDNLVAGGFGSAPTRTITITGGGGGDGLHGIVYDSANDRLFVSDVNTVGTDDGVIYVITGVNALTDGTTVNPTTDGNVTTIGVAAGGGTNSVLETPVDIEYDGTFLYVADKTGDDVNTSGAVRRYNVSGVLPSGDVADDGSIGVVAPESVSVYNPVN